MSGPQFKRIDCDVQYLLSAIDRGTIGLPEIERPLLWPAAKVRDLFDSMFRGYPIGHLLLWAAPDTEATTPNNIEGHGQYTPATLILDGQQRVTAVYAVMNQKPISTQQSLGKPFSIAFRPSTGEFELSTAEHNGSLEWIADISALYARGDETYKVISQFIGRLAERRELRPNENEIIAQNIQRLLQLSRYPITAFEINPDTDEEDVADIFFRTKRRGQKSDQGNFMLTLVAAFWPDGSDALAQFCEQSGRPGVKYNSSYNHFIQPDPTQLLQVAVGLGFRHVRLKDAYLILRGKNPITKPHSSASQNRPFEKLKWALKKVIYLKNWHDFLKVPVYAGYRSALMIPSETALAFSYLLYLIGRYDFDVDPRPLKSTMARWFFMASITGRYLNSAEARMEKDLIGLHTLKNGAQFVAHLEKVIEDELSPDFWATSLPIDLSTADPRSPLWFAYCAALHLLEAPVLFSRMKVAEFLDPATPANKTAIERHPLFPKETLHVKGISDDRVSNQLANFTLMEWDKGIHRSGSSPGEYLSAYMKRFKGDPGKLTQMLKLHALPDKWDQMPYDEFIIKRRKLMAKVIHSGYKRLPGHLHQ